MTARERAQEAERLTELLKRHIINMRTGRGKYWRVDNVQKFPHEVWLSHGGFQFRVSIRVFEEEVTTDVPR